MLVTQSDDLETNIRGGQRSTGFFAEDLENSIFISQLERDFDENTICATNTQPNLTENILSIPNLPRDLTPSNNFVELDPFEEKRSKCKPFRMNKNCFVNAVKQVEARNKKIEVIYLFKTLFNENLA